MHCSQQPLADGERGRESQQSLDTRPEGDSDSDMTDDATVDTKQQKKQKNKKQTSSARTRRTKFSGAKRQRPATPPLEDPDATQTEDDDTVPLSLLKSKAKPAKGSNKKKGDKQTDTARPGSVDARTSRNKRVKFAADGAIGTSPATATVSASSSSSWFDVLTSAVKELRKRPPLALNKRLSDPKQLEWLLEKLPLNIPSRSEICRVMHYACCTKFDATHNPPDGHAAHWLGRTMFDSHVGDDDDGNHDVWDEDCEDATYVGSSFSEDHPDHQIQKRALLGVIENRPKRKHGTSELKFDKESFHAPLLEFAKRGQVFILRTSGARTLGGWYVHSGQLYPSGVGFAFDATDKEFCSGAFDPERKHVAAFIRAISKNRATHSVHVRRVILRHTEEFDARETEKDETVRRRNHNQSWVDLFDMDDHWCSEQLLQSWTHALSGVFGRNDPVIRSIWQYGYEPPIVPLKNFAWAHIADDRRSYLAASNPFLKSVEDHYSEIGMDDDGEPMRIDAIRGREALNRSHSSDIGKTDLESTTFASSCFGLVVIMRFRSAKALNNLDEFTESSQTTNVPSSASSSSASVASASASSAAAAAEKDDPEPSPISWSAAELLAPQAGTNVQSAADWEGCEGVGLLVL